MKKNVKTLTVYGLLISGLIFISSCEKSDSSLDTNDQQFALNDAGFADNDYLKSAFVETSELTKEEVEMLQYMKEEEKLARDVYYALYDKWNSQIFLNISKAEERHISAILTLANFYNLDDTVLKAPGEFENADFKALYDDLVEKGSESLEESLKVGALIEELDIKDLQDDLEITSNENITMVFNNLLRGSRNHLRAFNRQLINLELTYEPQFISQEEYDTIVNSANERGNRQGNMNATGECKGNKKGSGNGECDGTGNNGQQSQQRNGKNK